jgi:hypothetical protein
MTENTINKTVVYGERFAIDELVFEVDYDANLWIEESGQREFLASFWDCSPQTTVVIPPVPFVISITEDMMNQARDFAAFAKDPMSEMRDAALRGVYVPLLDSGQEG